MAKLGKFAGNQMPTSHFMSVLLFKIVNPLWERFQKKWIDVLVHILGWVKFEELIMNFMVIQNFYSSWGRFGTDIQPVPNSKKWMELYIEYFATRSIIHFEQATTNCIKIKIIKVGTLQENVDLYRQYSVTLGRTCQKCSIPNVEQFLSNRGVGVWAS